MQTFKFKTNINCGNCIRSVTPSLDNSVGASNWKVDIDNPEKILTVETEQVSSAEIIQAVEKAGFDITEMKQ